MGIPIIVEERFDALSLARYIKNIGRAYQRQSVELVNLCRIFVETFPPEKRHSAIPKLTMLAIIEALRTATVAGKGVTDKASGAFHEVRVKLLRYRATVHPRLQDMDSMITNRMAQAREKDERSLGLFNQLREKRGPTEPSRLPNTSSRIRMVHMAQCVDTEAQVACSPKADAPSETSAPALTLTPSPTRVRVKERLRSPTDNGYTPGSPHILTRYTPLASIPQKRPTAGPCSTTTTTHIPPAPGAPVSPEIHSHRSSSTIVTPAIQQPSSQPRDTQSTTVPERPESVSIPPSSMSPHIPTPPLPSSPPPSTRIDTPSNPVDVVPMVSPERRNETIQPSSNLLPQSEEKRTSSIKIQAKFKWSTGDSITWKPSGKFAPFSISSSPSPPKTREAPNRLTMPGAYPGMPVDVDDSSWVLVGPVSPVEVSKRSWIMRLFAR